MGHGTASGGGGGASSLDQLTDLRGAVDAFILRCKGALCSGGVSPYSSSTTFGRWGFFEIYTVDDAASAFDPDSTSEGKALRQDTLGTSGHYARSYGNVFAAFQPNALPAVCFGFKISHTTDINFFAGITSFANVVNAANPTGQHIGLQYVSSRDSNFQWMSKDTTTQNVEDSGQAVATEKYFLTLEFLTPSSCELKLYDADQTLLQEKIVTSNLPTGSVLLFAFSGVYNVANSVRSIHQFGTVGALLA